MVRKQEAHLKQIQNLTLPLTRLKGVGPKRAALLAQKGLHTLLDLLFFTPIRYEDRTRITPIAEAMEGQTILVKGRVVRGREERFPRRTGFQGEDLRFIGQGRHDLCLGQSVHGSGKLAAGQ